MSMNDPLNHLGSEPLEVPYSLNQFLGWDFFCHFLQQTGYRRTFKQKSCWMCKSVLHKSGHIKIVICLSIIVTLHLGKLPTHSSGLRNSDTVKLGVKELFTDYQPFHIINLLLYKELLYILEILKLGVSQREIVKISKKWGLSKNVFPNFKLLAAHFRLFILKILLKAP